MAVNRQIPLTVRDIRTTHRYHAKRPRSNKLRYTQVARGCVRMHSLGLARVLAAQCLAVNAVRNAALVDLPALQHRPQASGDDEEEEGKDDEDEGDQEEDIISRSRGKTTK